MNNGRVFLTNRLPTLLAALLCIAACLPAQTTAPPLKASPATMTFSHTEGADKLPATQTLAISGGSTASPLTYQIVISGGPWLVATPITGAAPASVKVTVNPTSLTVGTFTGTITVSSVGGSTPQTATVAVTLTIKGVAPTLSAAPSPVSLSYIKGGAVPDAAKVKLTTSGALLPYTVATAGGTWLSVTPKSGIVFPAFATELSVAVSPASLAPGTYKGTVTITAAQAANKTTTVNVTLTVTAGLPTVTGLWPDDAVQGAPATTITVTGSNFFSGTTIKAGATTLSSTLLGPDAMTAVIPSSLLAAAGTLNIVANNTGTGGGDSTPAQEFTVHPPGPNVSAVVNAASFLGASIAPGEMVVIFGRSLGPASVTSFDPPASGSPIATTLAGTTVTFDSTAAPVIYTSANQVAVMVPYDVAGKSNVQIAVDYQGTASTAVTVPVAVSAPGIYTASGTGGGPAAAFNYDATSGSYTLNTEATGAAKGSVIVFYLTGEGGTGTDGMLVTTPAVTPNPAVAVTVGAATATVLYTGGIVGLVQGLMQINAQLPNDMTAGKALPLTVTINGQASQTGVTVTVK
ncbi:MAG: IPT/TIG domain-containing protein [Acidobacteria bacterium]|nr:IPT/TIG domain-containing protein [Acidobacteriota bacterium]